MTESTLPAGYSWRRPTLEDAPALTALVLAHDAHFLPAPDVTGEQIEALLRERTVDLASRAWLVVAPDGELCGAALVYVDPITDESELDIYPHPDAPDEVIDWLFTAGRQAVADARAATGLRLPLMAGLHQDDQRSSRVYLDAGLQRVRLFWRMSMDLPSDLPPVAAPVGYRVRPVVTADSDLRGFHAATEDGFADHWRHHRRDYDTWIQDVTGLAGHDYALWWVAETDTGETVATMIGGHRMRDLGAGYVYTLSTLPAHRGRGLAKTLLRRAMHDAAAAGYGGLQLTVDAANPTGATRLYQSVGMQVAAAFSVYSDEK